MCSGDHIDRKMWLFCFCLVNVAIVLLLWLLWIFLIDKKYQIIFWHQMNTETLQWKNYSTNKRHIPCEIEQGKYNKQWVS